MENVNVSVSLTVSRWHKVSERLKGLIDECEQAMKHAFKSTTAQAYLGPAQITEFERLRAKGLEAKNKIGRLLSVRCLIRNAIAKHNTASGIHELLAEIEANRQHIRIIREILKHQHAGRVPIDRIEAVFLDASKSEKTLEAALESWGSNDDINMLYLERSSVKAGVDVAMLTPDEIQEFKTLCEKLELRNFKIHDMLADANIERVSLEIPEDLAKRLAIV
ncbi:MAG TPA: hypothetical protein PLU72_17005 [Candidatus Ozemobacteraceae bacterium]|nr:hypothetical protein [Candidatus Ozemobacteraceae bacterium]HQG28077.1 hypothetical protein [Candidatus Ozemobacteraceae bacterium]